MERARLDGLDGLRGVAALCVFLSHVFSQFDGNAYLAVDFFFMLSGYVMARSYEPELRVASRYQAGWSFLAARFKRLYPVVLVGSLIGLPVLFLQNGANAWPIALACLLLVPFDGPRGPYMLNPPVWSIAYELMANLAHAVLLARLRTELLLVFCAALTVLLLIAVDGHGLAMVPNAGSRVVVAVRTLLPYTLGVVLYRTWEDRPPWKIGAVTTWLTMPVFFVVVPMTIGSKGLADFVFVLVVCPLLVAGGLQNGQGSRIAHAVGGLSFPLYAVHGPIVLTLQAWEVPESLQVAAGLLAGILLFVAMRSGGNWFHARRPDVVEARV